MTIIKKLSREELHRTFGGVITINDFDTVRGRDQLDGSPIAMRIENDLHTFGNPYIDKKRKEK